MYRKKNNDLLHEESCLFKYYKPKKHQILQKRSSNDNSRKIVVQHLRKTIYVAFIKELYEELTLYLKALIYEAAIACTDSTTACRLIGDNTFTMKASEIIQYSSMEQLIEKVAANIVQSLENERSTKELLKKIGTKLDIKIDDSILEAVVPYLELRHKLVHTDGKIDSDFMARFQGFKYTDGYVSLGYETIDHAREKVGELVASIDGAALAKGILRPNA
ncbi:MAG TPA: hypothetical protein PKB13_09895 [Clostridia bacterium]|nr:hypothetical protein [Clostridia bacterium]